MRYLAILLGIVLPLAFASCALIPDKKGPVPMKGYTNGVYRLPPREQWSPQTAQVVTGLRERMARDKKADRITQGKEKDYGDVLERALVKAGVSVPKNSAFRVLPEGYILVHSSPEFHRQLSRTLFVRIQ